MTESNMLETAAEVINALGGTAAVRQLTGAKTSSVVSNWKTFGRFPADTFDAMTAALAERKQCAPPSLWRQREPAS